MTFEDQLNALVYFHLEEHASGRDLIQALEENDFARQEVAPEGGIQKSSFFEALGTRGLEQLLHVYNGLMADASSLLPKDYAHLGDLQAIDCSLVDAVILNNPAESILSLEAPTGSEMILFNMNGQREMNIVFSSDHMDVSVDHLKRGMYILTNDWATFSRRVLLK